MLQTSPDRVIYTTITSAIHGGMFALITYRLARALSSSWNVSGERSDECRTRTLAIGIRP
jgi:hypothetical protein